MRKLGIFVLILAIVFKFLSITIEEVDQEKLSVDNVEGGSDNFVEMSCVRGFCTVPESEEGRWERCVCPHTLHKVIRGKYSQIQCCTQCSVNVLSSKVEIENGTRLLIRNSEIEFLTVLQLVLTSLNLICMIFAVSDSFFPKNQMN